MKKLAIITARGGSKRIPKKNIKLFLGKPIIAYSILASIESGLFDEVMVSTDDEEIAEISRKYGASVPFMRSANTSNDHATTADAILEVLEAYKRIGETFEYACCLYPTAPFVTAEKLVAAYGKLKSEKLDAVFPVMPFGYPIWRSLKMENGRLQLNWEEYKNARSQDLPTAYHDAGQFYFFNVAVFMQKKTIMTDNMGGINISEMEGQDIDNETDWQLAELKYQLMHKND